MLKFNKSLIVVFIITTAVFLSQGFVKEKHEDEKPTNLTVLPKDISGEELHKIMKEYSKALGVRCGYCHERKEVQGEKPHLDFALDGKHEKEITRKMMEMVNAINANYISKMGKGNFAQVQCVTCHMGRTEPIASVDSLPQKPKVDSVQKAPVIKKD